MAFYKSLPATYKTFPQQNIKLHKDWGYYVL